MRKSPVLTQFGATLIASTHRFFCFGLFRLTPKTLSKDTVPLRTLLMDDQRRCKSIAERSKTGIEATRSRWTKQQPPLA
ncbi:hypothetical protein HJFPF1_10025 [Paramyrothecium foliicola]|nr:hypothetical protein HJFPF1_10025 [Paramyrothecium foliicola]